MLIRRQIFILVELYGKFNYKQTLDLRVVDSHNLPEETIKQFVRIHGDDLIEPFFENL